MTSAGLAALAVVGGATAVLEILTRSGAIDAYILIPPSVMLIKLVTITAAGEINDAAVQTGRVMVIAIALSIGLGFGLGRLIHVLPRLRRVLNPLFTSYYAVPVFVFYPIFIVLFGLNDIPLVLVGSLFGIVAMVVATLNALDRVPAVYIRTASVMRLTPLQRQLHIVLPAMAPHLVIGLKLAVAYSMIGVVAGEFILANEGIGFRIAYAYNNFESDRMYALMLLLLLVSVTLNLLLQALERALNRRTAG